MLISDSSGGSSGISQLESNSSSSAQRHHKCSQRLKAALQASVCGGASPTSQVRQAGPVLLPLLTGRFRQAEIRGSVAGSSEGQPDHLPAPGDPPLRHLQKQKRIRQDRDREEKQGFVLRRFHLFSRSQVGAGDQQLGQVPDPVLLLPLELIFLLQQLGQNLLLSGCGLSDAGNLETSTSDS